MKRIQILMAAVCAAVFIRAGEGYAQNLTLTIPDTTGLKGQEMLVPVYFGTAEPEDQIFSIQTGFSAGSQIFSITGIQTAGTMSAGLSTVFNPHNSQLAVASSEPITGQGILVFLKVLPTGAPNATTSFNLVNPRLNEGNPSVLADNGTFRLRYISINPKSPPNNLIVGDSLQFSVTGDAIPPFVWTVSDTSLLSISASGKVKVKKQGIATVSVSDAEGKSDESNRFTLNSPSLKALTVSFPDTAIRQTQYVDFPIRITDVTGLAITSYEMSISFPSIVTFHGVISEGTLTESWLPASVLTGNNSVTLASATTVGLNGAGTLVKIRFRVKETATGSGAVSFSSVLFNETIQSAVDNGTIQALAAPVINTTPATADLVVGGSVQASVLNGGTGPFTWESQHPAIASVDEESGIIHGVSRGKTQVVAIDSEGFRSKPVNVTVSDFLVSLSQTEALAGEPFLIEINLPESFEGNLVSSSLTFHWDTTTVRFLGFRTEGYQTAGWVNEYSFRNDTLVIAAAGASPLSSGLPFAALEVVAQMAGSWPVAFTGIRFNEPSPETPLAQTQGLSVLVGSQNQPPVWETVLPDTSIAENQNLSFTVLATDADSPVAYQLIQAPEGASLNTTSGLFEWTPTFTQAGDYEVIISVSDGSASVPDTATITVTNTNRPPGAFSLLSPADGDTIVKLRPEPVVFRWQPAVDPDGDAVVYRLRVRGEDFDFRIEEITDDSVSVDNLKPELSVGETYTWSVVAHDPMDSSAESSEEFSFFVLEQGVFVEDSEAPVHFSVSPAYPNPFNPETKFTLRLPMASDVSVSVFDIAGRQVMTLPIRQLPPGNHTLSLTAGNLASGNYLVRIVAGSLKETLKISLQK